MLGRFIDVFFGKTLKGSQVVGKDRFTAPWGRTKTRCFRSGVHCGRGGGVRERVGVVRSGIVRR